MHLVVFSRRRTIRRPTREISQPTVQRPCTGSTKHMYTEYKAHVLRVQKPCTAAKQKNSRGYNIYIKRAFKYMVDGRKPYGIG